MPVMRLNLGANPRIMIEQCGGNLEIRGWSREETVIEYEDREADIESVEGTVKLSTDNSCAMRVPEAGTVSINNVDGNLKIKEVDSALNINHVGGTAIIRKVQTLHVGGIDGHLMVREVEGDFNFNHVGGNATLRDVHGMLTGESIDGHLVAKSINGGANIQHIGGNLAIKTDFKAETHYEFRSDGSVEIAVPEAADVRFQVEADGSIKADTNFQTILEGRQRIFVAGSGATTFKIIAGGSVRIKQRSMYRSEEDFPDGFEDFNEQMEDALSQLDIQFESIEAQLDRIPDHIRGRVSRQLDAARRRVMDAQRHATRTVERATRDIGTNPSVYVDFAGGQPSDPVSEDERMMILQMLEDGKITVQEAQKLLEALEGREA